MELRAAEYSTFEMLNLVICECISIIESTLALLYHDWPRRFTSCTAENPTLTPQFFSPWIVATTLRECLEALNSKYQIPCHVPVFSRPFVMGIVTLAPISADLT
jgi:hypothetical protein